MKIFKISANVLDIKRMMSSPLLEEINYRIETTKESEEETTFKDELQYLISEIGEESVRQFKKELEDIGIHLGIYKEIGIDKLKNIEVSRGKRYDIKRNGKYYIFDSWVPLESLPEI